MSILKPSPKWSTAILKTNEGVKARWSLYSIRVRMKMETKIDYLQSISFQYTTQYNFFEGSPIPFLWPNSPLLAISSSSLTKRWSWRCRATTVAFLSWNTGHVEKIQRGTRETWVRLPMAVSESNPKWPNLVLRFVSKGSFRWQRLRLIRAWYKCQPWSSDQYYQPPLKKRQVSPWRQGQSSVCFGSGSEALCGAPSDYSRLILEGEEVFQ